MTFEWACRNRGLIIDTNLLILLLVGNYRIGYIRDCSRTTEYSEDDFNFVVDLIKTHQPKIILTPQILAELSNLTFKGMLTGQQFDLYFKEVHALIKLAVEEHVKKIDILNNFSLLSRFGFTDLSILEAAKSLECAVITDDDKFFPELLRENCLAVNLNHIKAAAQS